ncbi:MAG: YncE family protein [Actinomycetota bacterium]|nr:YncE family protein [Actinomycetota bacterium]
MKPLMAVAMPAALLASLLAPSALAPSALAGDTAMTTLTMLVAGCNGCTITPINSRSDADVAYRGAPATVRKGVATMTVPTASTVGMYFDIRRGGKAWDSQRPGRVLIAVQYGGAPVGSRVTARQAKRARSGSPCWVGTSRPTLALEVRVETVKIPTLVLGNNDETSSRLVDTPLAWLVPTQPSLEPSWRPANGVLITDEQVDCEAEPRTGPIVGRAVGWARAGSWTDDLEVGPSGRFGYVVTAWNVQVLRLARARLVDTITGLRAGSIALARSGTRAYVPVRFGKRISVINTRTGRVTNRFDAPGEISSLAVTRDGSELYVPIAYRDTVAVMGARTGKVLARIPIPGNDFGYSIIMSLDGGRAYLSNGFGKVVVIDTAIRKVVNFTTLRDEGPGLSTVTGFAVTPDGERLLLASPERRAVVVLDSTTLREIARWRVRGRPHDVVVDPQGRRAYVSTNGIVPVDLATGEVLREIPVPRPTSPVDRLNVFRQRVNHLAISPDGRRLMAGTSENWTVVIAIVS